MQLTIKLSGKELREIEDFVQMGEVESVHDFIRYAIQNQLQLERDNLDSRKFKEPRLPKTVTRALIKEKDKRKPVGYFGEGVRTIAIPPSETNKFISIDISKIKYRTEHPLWALKNKYFPLKFVLRIIQNMVANSDKGKIFINSLRQEIKNKVFIMREELEFLDKKMENKRGETVATGFPTYYEKNRDKIEKSFNRFFHNFAIYVSPDGALIKGMPYELGFIDVDDGKIVLTEDGNNFANFHSPILDGYLREGKMPKYQFSDEELNFLFEHIQQKATSEKMLYKFMLSQIEKGTNTPDELNEAMKPYLEEKFPKEDGYSEKSANSIRAGVTSRMVELKLIKIEKVGGKSFYKIGEDSKMFMEV